ncbi:MAG: hypothetical protein AB1Z55_07465 [Acidimicrobiia bacterium]
MTDVLILLVLLGVPATLVAVLARSARRGSLRWYRLAAAAAVGLAPVGGLLTLLSVVAYESGPGRTTWIEPLGWAASLLVQVVALVVAVVGVVRSLRSESGTAGWQLIATAVALGTVAVVGLVVLAAWDTVA